MKYFKLIVQVIMLLIVQPVFSQCLKEPKVTFSPLKEIYQPNDTILIKFEFLYKRIDVNWLSAVQVEYTDTWDMIPPFSAPNNCCDPTPYWEWDSRADKKGDTIQGFFFTDGRINQVYGDNCLCIDCGSNFIDYFMFSWTMVVNSCENIGNLVLMINTYSDSEIGTWHWKGCEEDEVIIIGKKKDCFTTNCNKF